MLLGCGSGIMDHRDASARYQSSTVEGRNFATIDFWINFGLHRSIQLLTLDVGEGLIQLVAHPGVMVAEDVTVVAATDGWIRLAGRTAYEVPPLDCCNFFFLFNFS